MIEEGDHIGLLLVGGEEVLEGRVVERWVNTDGAALVVVLESVISSRRDVAAVSMHVPIASILYWWTVEV